MDDLKHLNPCWHSDDGHRVSVIGNGGREDAIKWKLKRHRHCLVDKMVSLIIVGPEKPLVDGLVDITRNSTNNIVGPNRIAAKLEGSKLFAKQFMQRHNIPTAHWQTYKRNPDGMNQLILYAQNKNEYPIVLKEDGLCAGKGVQVCKTDRELWQALPQTFLRNIHNSQSNKVLLEDFIEGDELSCFIITDGYDYKLLPFVRDYKRAYDNDEGPNTGGMGATSDIPFLTEKLVQKIRDKIIQPTLGGCRDDGFRYTGILYFGLMICNGEPYVIEYNVRFGDPECQLIMLLWEQDIYEYMKATTTIYDLGKLPDVEFSSDKAVTVTLASGGYPGKYETGYEIHGLDRVPKGVVVFTAGVREEDGKYYTDGGRVMNVTAKAPTVEQARELAYSCIGENGIHFEGMEYRTDIGKTNEDIHVTNETPRWNKRRSGRNNTELCRKRFQNHAHNRRASLLHNR
jgi:phosphoribosylamine---glycine ligase